MAWRYIVFICTLYGHNTAGKSTTTSTVTMQIVGVMFKKFDVYRICT